MAKTCFIISPIGSDGSDTRRRADQLMRYVFRPALEKCGYEAVRADEISTPGLITQQVISRLISSDLAIADLTGRNPNVFYELGIRHALNKPVIQVIEAGESLPFDIAQVRTVMIDHRDLDSVFDAKDSLVASIQALENEAGYRSPVDWVRQESEQVKHGVVAVDAYLGVSEPDESSLKALKEAVLKIQEELNLLIDSDPPAEKGSWWKQWLFKTKDALSEPAMAERMRKLELGVETATLKKHQAEVDEKQGNAAGALIKALENVPNAAVRVGSILIVKRTDDDGQAAIAVRNLTTTEIILLDKQPTLLQDPSSLLRQLEQGTTAFLASPHYEAEQDGADQPATAPEANPETD